MVMEILGFLRGVPGLYMAGVMSAALSSLSSNYNAVSATITRDIVHPVYEYKYKTTMSDRASTWTAKIISEYTYLHIKTHHYIIFFVGPLHSKLGMESYS